MRSITRRLLMSARSGTHASTLSRVSAFALPARGMASADPLPAGPRGRKTEDTHRVPPVMSAADAVSGCVRSGSRIFVHTAACTPTVLLQALADVAIAKDLKDIETCHLHIEGPAVHVDATRPGLDGRIRDRSFFVGANLRSYVNATGDFVPIFLSEIPLLFRRGKQRVDVAFVQVSPPDSHGFHSIGVGVDVTRAALEVADKIIAVVNPNVPRTFGDAALHTSHIHAVVHSDAPLYERKAAAPSAEASHEEAIGRLIADNLVDNGATLQMGIGGIPDAVLRFCSNHSDLGIHTEMISDGAVALIESGAVNNSKKTLDAGRSVATFAFGTRKLYDFLDNNPGVAFFESSYTNDTAIIRRQPRMTAINSCIEVDLTGQVVADSIGPTIFSGVGGQMDFIRGASLCPDGKAIIAVPSRTHKGISRIVPFIKQGAGVVTTRAHMHYIVTEHGIADLFGKSLRERAAALIGIAHPDDRQSLEKAAVERHILGQRADGVVPPASLK